jgi:hypothetical protein
MVEVLSHLEADELLRFRVIEELRRALLPEDREDS